MLGPGSPDSTTLTERVRDLEVTRARAVDDSAARLRSIERDLHDGAQAQLVALAMKLGLAKEKLGVVAPPDLTRVAQLVDDAHLSAIEAIAELRTLARGIHPSVLDNGLTDALITLAARSVVPVDLVTDIPERPSAAIETIAYFSAAECSPTWPSTAARGTLPSRPCTSPACSGSASPTTATAAPPRCPAAACAGWPNGSARSTVSWTSTARRRPTVVTVELPSHA